MLGQSGAFGVAYADKFPQGSAGQRAFAVIAAALAEVAAANKSRSQMRERGTRGRGAARRAMLSGIGAVVRTAKAIADETPGADSRFQPPAQRSDVVVLATARAFLDDLPAVKDVFVEHGLPDTCVDDLRRTTEAFAQAISGFSAGKSSLLDAQADLVAAVKRGMKAVRLLDVIVPNVFGAGSPVAEKWKRERYVESVGGSASTTEAGAEVTPGIPAAPQTEDPLRRAS